MSPVQYAQIDFTALELMNANHLRKPEKERACKTALALSPPFLSLSPVSTAYIKVELWVLTRLYCFILLHEFFSVYTYA